MRIRVKIILALLIGTFCFTTYGVQAANVQASKEKMSGYGRSEKARKELKKRKKSKKADVSLVKELTPEQQRRYDGVEDGLVAGELVLRQRVGTHGRDDHHRHGSHNGGKQAVEQILRERHPGVGTHRHQVDEVVPGGVDDIHPGREDEQLVKGLEGIDDGIHQR